MNAQQASEFLRNTSRELTILSHMEGLLGWDQQTGMPVRAAAERGEQMAFLSELQHRKATAPELGEALEMLKADPQDWEPGQVACAARDYERAQRIPLRWAVEFAKVTGEAHTIWEEAREKSAFTIFQPCLERIVEMRREYATFFPECVHPYDALLEDFEPGLRTAELRRIFAELRERQTVLLQEVVAKQSPYRPFAGEFPVDRQRLLTKHLFQLQGLDAARCRVAESVHPFTTTLAFDDVRITTHYDKGNLSSLFSSLHEGGHALYELNIDPALRYTPWGTLRSLILHESQSRLWENIVGRNRKWLGAMYSELQRFFPEALAHWSCDDFRRTVNFVQPGLIRVDADEVSYNLHIMLRFELELALMENKLTVADLPEAWNARMLEYLQVQVPCDRDGVLQDVHWAGGAIGYFPTYALGNLAAAQLWEKAVQDCPEWEAEFSTGRTGWLNEWLKSHVHHAGARYSAPELIEKVTGKPLNSDAYLRLLEKRYQ